MCSLPINGSRKLPSARFASISIRRLIKKVSMANHKLNFRWSNVSVVPRISSSFLIVRRAYTSTVAIVRSSFYRQWHVIIISIIRFRFFLVVVVILVATRLLVPLFSINKNLTKILLQTVVPNTCTPHHNHILVHTLPNTNCRWIYIFHTMVVVYLNIQIDL